MSVPPLYSLVGSRIIHPFLLSCNCEGTYHFTEYPSEALDSGPGHVTLSNGFNRREASGDLTVVVQLALFSFTSVTTMRGTTCKKTAAMRTIEAPWKEPFDHAHQSSMKTTVAPFTSS